MPRRALVEALEGWRVAERDLRATTPGSPAHEHAERDYERWRKLYAKAFLTAESYGVEIDDLPTPAALPAVPASNGATTTQT